MVSFFAHPELDRPACSTSPRGRRGRRAPRASASICGRQIARMVADEEAAIVRDVGVHDVADDVVVEVLDGLVAGESSRR